MEHAQVNFQGAIVVSFLDTKGNSRTFSNVRELNTIFSQDWEAGMPTIALQEQHDGESGKLSNLKMMIDLAGVNPADVRRIQVLSTFKYKLQDYLRLEMIGMIEAAVETPNGAGKVTVTGDLKFE